MIDPELSPYVYEAVVTNVVDGDTIDCSVDLGFSVSISCRFRLSGIDAPELRGTSIARGRESGDWLRKQIIAKRVTIVSDKDKTGKYGRYLATVWCGDLNVNKRMVELGYAVPASY